jgi:SAM-dependent methyltransferase
VVRQRLVSAGRNPWLDIPLADYEAHMALPAVGQAAMLATQLELLLAQFAPRSVAVIGCAGGNGFDRIDTRITSRVVAVDINAHYLEAVQHRYGQRIPGLECCVANVEAAPLRVAPVDLIYAALLFEYVDPGRTLVNLARLARPGGVLGAVLQLPGHATVVSPSPFATVQTLASALHPVPPDALVANATAAGFSLLERRTLDLASGKSFAVLAFRAAA